MLCVKKQSGRNSFASIIHRGQTEYKGIWYDTFIYYVLPCRQNGTTGHDITTNQGIPGI